MTTMSSTCTPKARRQVAALVIKPPISGPAAEPSRPRADGAEGASTRLDVVVKNGGQDIDGRDQQRRADALAQRVALRSSQVALARGREPTRPLA